MRERPILMNAPMVRAVLAGTKTQTRRIVKPQPGVEPKLAQHLARRGHYEWFSPNLLRTWRCPYGQPGDRLWVRETWNKFPPWEGYFYAADDHSFGIGECDDSDHIEPHNLRWKPSIHMPREASRLTLEITEVRVERLNEISEEDAKAEGIAYQDDAKEIGRGRLSHDGSVLYDTAREAFVKLWESINGPGSWALNPFVWVITFRRVGL